MSCHLAFDIMRCQAERTIKSFIRGHRLHDRESALQVAKTAVTVCCWGNEKTNVPQCHSICMEMSRLIDRPTTVNSRSHYSNTSFYAHTRKVHGNGKVDDLTRVECNVFFL